MARFISGPRLLPTYCIEEKTSDDVGKDTDYPIGLTYDQWFENYFRVKDWNLEIQYTMSGNCSAGDANASTSIAGPTGSFSTSILSSEKSFSCIYNVSGALADNNSGSVTDSTDEAFASVALSATFNTSPVNYNFYSCYKVDDLFYPKFLFSFMLTGLANGGSDSGFPFFEATLVPWVRWNFPNPLYTPYDIPLDLNGVTGTREGTLYLGNSSEGSGSAIVDITMSMIKLTPKSYWSYDGIWDTTTGAQILNPFNP